MFGLSMGSFAVGVVAGVAASMVYGMIDHAKPGKPSGMPGTNAAGHPTAKLHGKIVNGPIGNPSPFGQPKAGLATVEPYEWGYVVGAGDSSGSIAEAVTGDDARYVELVAANPQIPRTGELGIYLGDKQWDFQPGALKVGDELLLPLPWYRYIDQMGNPRGGTTPFPSDPRASGQVLSDGVGVSGPPPYGQPFALGAAA